ncbi:MAG: YceD family protein [Flavobacteriales bacterium]
MKTNNEYIIPFVSLKIGIHKFEFEITNSFFDNFDYSIIRKGKVQVELSFEKKETMLIGNYKISGYVESHCDRCNDLLSVDVNGAYKVIYKFDSQPSNDETLIIIYPEEYELDISETILEFIMVSEDIVDKDDSSSETSEEEKNNEDDTHVDPRWKALKELSSKKKPYK